MMKPARRERDTIRVRAGLTRSILTGRHALALCVAALPLIGPATARPQAAPDPSFTLSTPAPDRSPSPFIGNGRLGGTIPALAISAAPFFLAGLYENATGDVPRIAELPAWNTVDVFDGIRWLSSQSPSPTNIRNYRQTLDMRAGTVRTTYEWVDGDRRTSIAVDALISRADPRVAAIRFTAVPHFTGRVRVAVALAQRTPPRRLPLGTATRFDPSWKPSDVWYPGFVDVASTSASLARHEALLSLHGNPTGRSTPVAMTAAIRWPARLDHVRVDTATASDSARLTMEFDAISGHSYTFDKIVGVATGGARDEATSAARRAATMAARQGFDALRANHVAAWARLWRTDIVVEGHPELQRVVHALLFQLLCSADSGTAMGIPPMGLSSGGYYGHVFWDSDTWMFPALVLTHPDIARSLVAFRSRTLAAARANARTNGFSGAMYPWEADERGRETTPRFAAQNARSEIHVTGDVALAAWQLYLATGDSAWLARTGFPILRETADFWLSRVSHDTARDVYHIRDVVSVDEGLVGVSDDAYTNSVARRNLEVATSAARRLGITPDPRWTRVATRLRIPFDSARGTYRTYEGAPDSTLGSVTALLSYPLGMPMRPDVKRANLRHAVHRMLGRPRGAMMGGTLLSVVAAELGDRALVDTLLPASYEGYLKGPFLQISETPRNDAVSFVTGAGGFLQQVLFGYTGLRITSGGVRAVFGPVLPSRVTRLVLRDIHSRGRRYDIVVDGAGRRIVEKR